MVDEADDQQSPGSLSLVNLVQEWLNINKTDSAWRILPDSPFTAFNRGVILDGYGWYFTVYKDYMTAGVGMTRDGERYDTGFLIDATDPEFFNKLKSKLDEIESTYPERHAEMMKAAAAAVARMAADKSSSPRILPEE